MSLWYLINHKEYKEGTKDTKKDSKQHLKAFLQGLHRAWNVGGGLEGDPERVQPFTGLKLKEILITPGFTRSYSH